MSRRISDSSWPEKEPWQIDFENEPVNDERWSCIVTSVIETKAEDEECLRILIQRVTHGQIPLIQSITMSDLFTMFKNERKPVEAKKKPDQKNDKKVKEQPKEEQRRESSSASYPPPRFPEVLAWISNHARSSEGQNKLPPKMVAYALKYMILDKKNKDYSRRRINSALKRKRRESEIRAHLIRKLRGLPEEKVVPESDEKEDDKMWRREKFDILEGSPSQQGPLNGPEMYIVLSDFYDPLYFAELRKINVPFVAVIKIENFKALTGKISSNVGLKKQELIDYFWTQFEQGVAKALTTNLYKDIALLKYMPDVHSDRSLEENSAILVNDLIATLYGTYHLNRLHQSYIQQMKVHRMIESLEPLDLSRCEVYNKLCDRLVTEDVNAEIFVLFSIIEQVVCGVPETKTRTLDYIREPSGIFKTDSNTFVSNPSFAAGEKEEACTALDCLLQSPRGRGREKLTSQSKNPVIYLYDDSISLTTLDMNQNILKTEAIFNRFVINSALSKVSIKYPTLTPAEKTKNDFQFFRLWERSKESEEDFKIKLYFFIVMRLMERTQKFEGGCEDFPSASVLSRGSSSDSDRTKSQSNITLPPDETTLEAPFFQEVAGLFYTKLVAPEVEGKKSSTKATLELRKATAFPELAPAVSSSLENLEVACGRCQKVEVQNNEKKNYTLDNVTCLEQLMESYEISYLSEPNLLVNRQEFQAFIDKHNFYEVLEPNRSVQRLQQLWDTYNTTEYTYFSPTDTLFAVGHNDADFRGVYHSQERGFIISPLCLRDFVIYVFPEKRKWMEKEDAEYIRFLEDVKEKVNAEEQKRDHEFKCKFLKNYYAMTEEEREKFLEVQNECDTKKKSISDKRKSEDITLDDLEDLPVKAKHTRPNRFQFSGLNFGDIRTQVNVIGNEFHSDDGTMVGIKTLSWLYGSSLITLTIRRMGSTLYLHKWTEDGIKKETLHFKDSSGALVTFDTDRSLAFLSKITWPNGLIIEPLPVKGFTTFYVKQTYREKYQTEEDTKTESFRCFLPNGQILIFRVDETIDILCPSGTIYRCQVQVKEKTKKLHRTSRKAKDERAEEQEIKIKEIVTPSGEVWIVEECSKCKNLVRKMIFLTGVDPGTNETFYRREDGTNCMLWPDGKLVTSYPDGTKITSKPKFEEEEIFIDGDAENIKKEPESEVSNKPKIMFSDDASDTEYSNGFVVVTCSYLMEHPRYSTVFFKSSKLEMRMPDKMKIVYAQEGFYKIESHHSVLKASSEGVEFFSVCSRCNKKSASTVHLNSSGQDLLCKTKDYYDKTFLVYSSGQILHKTKSEDLVAPEHEEEGSSGISTDRQPYLCDHHKLSKPLQRCLVLERGLTGIEFINDRSLYRYIGNLSEDTYYDLCKLSADNIRLEHAFFEPVYKTGKERYLIKYEENDSYPTRMTRKQLTETKSISAHATVSVQNANFKKKGKPKVIIARFIRVIHPDPATVMEAIANAVALYQKRTHEVTEGYRRQTKERKQFPFAKYVAKELQLIASSLCKSLDLYPHTCTTTPCTEIDIHAIGHNLELNSYFRDVNPDDLRLNILPRCKQILKPYRHEGIDKDIPEENIRDS